MSYGLKIDIDVQKLYNALDSTLMIDWELRFWDPSFHSSDVLSSERGPYLFPFRGEYPLPNEWGYVLLERKGLPSETKRYCLAVFSPHIDLMGANTENEPYQSHFQVWRAHQPDAARLDALINRLVHEAYSTNEAKLKEAEERFKSNFEEWVRKG